MNFEIEHWPHYFGKHALRRFIKGYIKGILLLSGIVIVSFALYFFTHIPVFGWIFKSFLFVLVISPLLPLISYIQRDKKNPSYGINKDGFLLNERGWNSAFFTWDEIASIKEFDHPRFGKELHFELKDYTKAINKPGQKFQQSLAREYDIEKQPKKISNQLVKGDVTEFIQRFVKYFNDYKYANPDLDEKGALETAREYVEKYKVEFSFDNAFTERRENFMNISLPVYLIKDSVSGLTIVVHIFERKVYFLVDAGGTKKYPHL